MSDWNGGSFSDGALTAGIGKLATFAGDHYNFSDAGNYFATIGASGIAAEITGADVGAAMAMSSIAWFSNHWTTQRNAQNGNPAQSIADKATQDGHLSLSEANSIGGITPIRI